MALPIRRKSRVFTWDSVRITGLRMPRGSADFNLTASLECGGPAPLFMLGTNAQLSA